MIRNINIKKLILIIISVIILSFSFTNCVFAEGERIESSKSSSSSSSSISQYINTIQGHTGDGTGSGAGQTVSYFGGQLIGTIQVVGTGIGIIMLIYIAIKYMTVAPSEKAEFKKTGVNFVIGAGILFSAVVLLQLVKNIMVNLTGTLAK